MLLAAFIAAAAAVACVSAQGTHDPQFRRPVPCGQLKDGNYVFGGCSRFYSMCANGVEHPMNCYAELVLNPDNNQCDTPANNWFCATGNAQPQMLYRTADAFTCKGNPDGNYEAESCSPQFYQCVHDNRLDGKCPAGLVFNPSAGVCDHAVNCAQQPRKHAQPVQLTSGGINSRQTRRSAGGSSVFYFPVRRSGASSSTGNVQDTFMQPQQPVPFLPANPQQAPVNAPIFAQQQTRAANPNPHAATPVQLQTQQPPPQEQPQLLAEPPALNCDGKEDGVYLTARIDDDRGDDGVVPCTSQFWKCANGNAYNFTCAAGLVYDVDFNQCNYADNVVACGGTPLPTPVSTSPQTAAATPSPFDCTGKADGFYELETCTSTFYTCHAGISTALSCAPGTVFDNQTSACEFPQDCGKPKVTSPPQEPHDAADFFFGSANPSALSAVQNDAVQLPSTSSQPPPAFNCTGQQDGYYYKKKCDSSYVICSNGHFSVQNCPASLLFDPELAWCTFADECGVTSTTTTTTTPQTLLFSVGATAPTQPEFDCTSKADGYYSKSECAEDFYLCAGGRTVPFVCPANLVFDAARMICEFPEQCGQDAEAVAATPSAGDFQSLPFQAQQPSAAALQPSIGAAAPQPPQTTTTTTRQPFAVVASRPVRLSHLQQQQQQLSPWKSFGSFQPQPQQSQVLPQQQQQQQPQSAQQKLNCSGRIDGYYFERSCSASYHVCVHNVSTRIDCPAGTVFDAATTACQLPNECGKTQKFQQTTTTTVSPVTVTPPPSTATDGKQRFSCATRANGFYVKRNCATSFYTCNGGIAVKTTCPTGLVLDIATGACEYPAQCGQPRNSSAAFHTLTTPTTPTTTVSTPFIPVNFDCAKSGDGHFALGGSCQPSYVVCSNGHAFEAQCPAGLLFDSLLSTCNFPEQCEVTTTTAAATAAAVTTTIDGLPRSSSTAGAGNAAKLPPQPSTFVTPVGVAGSGVLIAPKSGSNYSSVVAASQQQPVASASYASHTSAASDQPQSCGKFATGTHEYAPCSHIYLSCWDGQLTTGVCFGGLYYNAEHAFCDYQQNVSSCQTRKF